jgi:hypothetical protein
LFFSPLRYSYPVLSDQQWPVIVLLVTARLNLGDVCSIVLLVMAVAIIIIVKAVIGAPAGAIIIAKMARPAAMMAPAVTRIDAEAAWVATVENATATRTMTAVTANAMTRELRSAVKTERRNGYAKNTKNAATAPAATRMSAKAAWTANAKSAAATQLKSAAMGHVNQSAKK